MAWLKGVVKQARNRSGDEPESIPVTSFATIASGASPRIGVRRISSPGAKLASLVIGIELGPPHDGAGCERAQHDATDEELAIHAAAPASVVTKASAHFLASARTRPI